MKGSMRLFNHNVQLLESTPVDLSVFKPLVFLSSLSHSDSCRVSFPHASKLRLRICAKASSLGSNPKPGHIFDRIFSSASPSFSPSQSSLFSYPGSPTTNAGSSSWFWASNSPLGREGVLLKNRSPVLTVVLLGWLGAKRKHLRRYAEWYNAHGMNAFVFCIDVKEFIRLDLLKMIEDRMKSLSDELCSWVSKREDDGRERGLMFHTFSNTGFLVYGYLLDSLGESKCLDLEAKINGCIFDSGGGGFMDCKVWAAGWSAALLKKQSSSKQFMDDLEETNKVETEIEEKTPGLVETTVLAMLEKFFSAFLRYPDVRKRLENIISRLGNSPHCPQLYLYSTADKVVPYQLIESMIDEQQRNHRNVFSHNFRVSPHVDHFRTFPDTYTRFLATFIEECFAATKGS